MYLVIKVRSMQRSGTEAIRTQIQPSKQKWEINNITNSQNTKENICKHILRGTRNLSFVLRRSLLRTFVTIWILVITLECSNITASKSILREKENETNGTVWVNLSTHGSKSECSCFDQVLCNRV